MMMRNTHPPNSACAAIFLMNRPTRRRPLTKADLLPLPAANVRALSLEHHLALSVVRNGQGTVDQLACLARTTYFVFYMRDMIPHGVDLNMLRQAETVLERWFAQLEHDKSVELNPDELRTFEAIIALHDAQLTITPAHRYRDAWERVRGYFLSGKITSPIPQSTDI